MLRKYNEIESITSETIKNNINLKNNINGCFVRVGKYSILYKDNLGNKIHNRRVK